MKNTAAFVRSVPPPPTLGFRRYHNLENLSYFSFNYKLTTFPWKTVFCLIVREKYTEYSGKLLLYLSNYSPVYMRCEV